LVTLTGESGVDASEELELGHRVWPREENVELIGEEALDALEELRECAIAAIYGDPELDKLSSSRRFEVLNLGNVKERILLMLYTPASLPSKPATAVQTY